MSSYSFEYLKIGIFYLLLTKYKKFKLIQNNKRLITTMFTDYLYIYKVAIALGFADDKTHVVKYCKDHLGSVPRLFKQPRYIKMLEADDFAEIIAHHLNYDRQKHSQSFYEDIVDLFQENLLNSKYLIKLVEILNCLQSEMSRDRDEAAGSSDASELLHIDYQEKTLEAIVNNQKICKKLFAEAKVNPELAVAMLRQKLFNERSLRQLAKLVILHLQNDVNEMADYLNDVSKEIIENEMLLKSLVKIAGKNKAVAEDLLKANWFVYEANYNSCAKIIKMQINEGMDAIRLINSPLIGDPILDQVFPMFEIPGSNIPEQIRLPFLISPRVIGRLFKQRKVLVTLEENQEERDGHIQRILEAYGNNKDFLQEVISIEHIEEALLGSYNDKVLKKLESNDVIEIIARDGNLRLSALNNPYLMNLFSNENLLIIAGNQLDDACITLLLKAFENNKEDLMIKLINDKSHWFVLLRGHKATYFIISRMASLYADEKVGLDKVENVITNIVVMNIQGKEKYVNLILEKKDEASLTLFLSMWWQQDPCFMLELLDNYITNGNASCILKSLERAKINLLENAQQDTSLLESLFASKKIIFLIALQDRISLVNSLKDNKKNIVFEHLPKIIFSFDKNAKETWDEKIVKEYQKLFKCLSSDDWSKLLKKYKDEPQLINDLRYCLEKTGYSLNSLAKNDVQLADAIMGNKLARILFPVNQIVKTAFEIGGVDFVLDHRVQVVESVMNNGEEAKALFNINTSSNLSKKMLSLLRGAGAKEGLLYEKMKFSLEEKINIVMAHNEELKNNERYTEFYQQTRKELEDILLNKGACNEEQLEEYFKTTQSLFFSDSDKEAIYAFRNSQYTFGKESCIEFSSDKRKNPINEEKLARLKRDSVAAMLMLRDHDFYGLTDEQVVEVVVARCQDDESFRLELENKTINTSYGQPLNIVELALNNKMAAIRIVDNLNYFSFIGINDLDEIRSKHFVFSRNIHQEHFAILQIKYDPDVTKKAIKDQHKILSQRLHQDKSGSSGTNADFTKLTNAKDVLLPIAQAREIIENAINEKKKLRSFEETFAFAKRDIASAKDLLKSNQITAGQKAELVVEFYKNTDFMNNLEQDNVYLFDLALADKQAALLLLSKPELQGRFNVDQLESIRNTHFKNDDSINHRKLKAIIAYREKQMGAEQHFHNADSRRSFSFSSIFQRPKRERTITEYNVSSSLPSCSGSVMANLPEAIESPITRSPSPSPGSDMNEID